jgi:hypothetical protein
VLLPRRSGRPGKRRSPNDQRFWRIFLVYTGFAFLKPHSRAIAAKLAILNAGAISGRNPSFLTGSYTLRFLLAAHFYT